MITTDNFFEQEIVLQNNRSRLEPLTEAHYQHLLPIALHTEIWEYTGAKVKNEVDFRRYFDTALTEGKISVTGAAGILILFFIKNGKGVGAA